MEHTSQQNKKGHFQKGDIVQCIAIDVSSEAAVKDYLSFKPTQMLRIGKHYTVVEDSSYGITDHEWITVVGDGIHISGTYANQFIKIKENKSNTMIQKLNSTLKRILSTNLQKQYRAGIIDGNLELTDIGKHELLQLFAKDKEKELTKIADDILGDII